MKKYLPLLMAVVSLSFGACSAVPNHKTNYVAPSVSPVKSSVTGAQQKLSSIQTHAATSKTKLQQSQASIAKAAAAAKSASDRLKVLAKATEKESTTHTLVLQVQTDVDLLTQELLQTRDLNTSLIEENQQLTADAAAAQAQLKEAQTRADTLQNAVTTQTGQLNKANSDLNAAIIQGAIDKHNAHKFKWFIIGLAVFAGGAVMFGIFRGLAFVPPLLYITLGAPAAIGVFLFFWLGSG